MDSRGVEARRTRNEGARAAAGVAAPAAGGAARDAGPREAEITSGAQSGKGDRPIDGREQIVRRQGRS